MFLIDISVNRRYTILKVIVKRGKYYMAPRSSEANEQIKDERRSQILLSALKIFTRKGFAASKMSDIAGDTGISYGLVYHYFKSKDEIYTELIEYAINSIGKVIDDICINTEQPIEQIRGIVSRVLNSVEHKEASGYYYVLVMNALTCEAIPVPTSEIIKKSLSRLKMLSQIIKEGQKKGQIREGDPNEIAIACFSTVIGLALLKVSGAISKIPGPEIIMKLF